MKDSIQPVNDRIRCGYFQGDGGVQLYYEDVGEGPPIVFVHEFAGDMRIWAPQVNHFSRHFRVITFNARGYPPSDVPDDPALYSQQIAINDIAALIRHLNLDSAHVVGFSMGSFAALFLGLQHPELTRSVTPVCCGYGAEKHWEAIHRKNFLAFVDLLRDENAADEASLRYANAPTRTQLKHKDPKGWQTFAEQFIALSREGRAMTLEHILAKRPSLYDLEEEFRKMEVPVLLITGDEDEQTLQPGLFLKRHVRNLGLCVLPRSGHTVHLEETGLFNAILHDFIASIELGTWRPRDAASFATEHYLTPTES